MSAIGRSSLLMSIKCVLCIKAAETLCAQNKLQNDCVESCEILVMKGDILLSSRECITLFTRVDRHFYGPDSSGDSEDKRTKEEVHN